MGTSLLFSAILQKGDNFCDFLFASLEKMGSTVKKKNVLLLNPIALRKTKIVCNFGLSECNIGLRKNS